MTKYFIVVVENKGKPITTFVTYIGKEDLVYFDDISEALEFVKNHLYLKSIYKWVICQKVSNLSKDVIHVYNCI